MHRKTNCRKRRGEMTPEELQNELDSIVAYGTFAIVRAVAEREGLSSGVIQCPKCSSGVFSYRVAENGNVFGQCDRVLGQSEDGSDVFCISFVE